MRAALEASGVLERLVEMARARVACFGAAEVTFVLDGLARLELQPPTPFLKALAAQVRHRGGSEKHQQAVAMVPSPV